MEAAAPVTVILAAAGALRRIYGHRPGNVVHADEIWPARSSWEKGGSDWRRFGIETAALFRTGKEVTLVESEDIGPISVLSSGVCFE